jgi:hypothetical protein
MTVSLMVGNSDGSWEQEKPGKGIEKLKHLKMPDVFAASGEEYSLLWNARGSKKPTTAKRRLRWPSSCPHPHQRKIESPSAIPNVSTKLWTLTSTLESYHEA